MEAVCEIVDITVRAAPRDVLAATQAATCQRDAATLAVVLETEGSTYVAQGAMALFGASSGQAGWLSGGCLEPEIERVAHASADDGRLRWMEVDTREDEDLLAGSALGCRGRLRIALLPLRTMPGVETHLARWLAGRSALALGLHSDGGVDIESSGCSQHWRIDTQAPAWSQRAQAWRLRLEPPPEMIVLGAGPETATLLPLLRELGWRTTLVERRARWRGYAALADEAAALSPGDAVRAAPGFNAALVMHHNFELDREALEALAGVAVPYVGLLGPVRRREDLFRVLPESCRAALLPRLRSPVGLKLGGQGPQAIALSIAAQLQAWRHGEETDGEKMD